MLSETEIRPTQFTLWDEHKRIGWVRVSRSTANMHVAYGAVEFWIQRFARPDHDDACHDLWAGVYYALDGRFATMHGWDKQRLKEVEWNLVLSRICAEDALRIAWHRTAEGASEVIERRFVGRDLFTDAPCPFTIGPQRYFSFEGQDELEFIEECKTDILCALELRHRDATRPRISNHQTLYRSGLLGHVYQPREFSQAFDALAYRPMCLGLSDGITITKQGRAELRRRVKEGLTPRLSRLVLSQSSTPSHEDTMRCFICYSHADELHRGELEKSLSLLKRQEIITVWHDRKILPGDEWERRIDQKLESADIILLLVSPDFLDSNYCYDIEMKRALERHNAGDARVIPVILRPCDWHSAPFGKLQALPKDAKPITQWADRDEAWLDVAQGLRRISRNSDADA